MQGSYGGAMISNLDGKNEIYDNKNAILNINPIFDTPGLFDTYGLTKFTCQEDGIYVFNSKSKLKCIEYPVEDYVFPNSIEYDVRFVVYSDNTFATEINASNTVNLVINAPVTDITSYDFDSPPFSLVAGNVVVVEISVPLIDIIGTGFYYLTAIYDSTFQLISDNFNCESENIGNSSLPYVTTLEYPLCFADYNTANINKKGYINVNGFKHWIREIKYVNGKKSSLVLMTNDLLCGC
jgi:hypothetical protein